MNHQKAAPGQIRRLSSRRCGTACVRRPSKSGACREEKRRSQSQDRPVTSVTTRRQGRARGQPPAAQVVAVRRQGLHQGAPGLASRRSVAVDRQPLLGVAYPGHDTVLQVTRPSRHRAAVCSYDVRLCDVRLGTAIEYLEPSLLHKQDRDLNTPPLPTPLSPSLMTESGSGDESRPPPESSAIR